MRASQIGAVTAQGKILTWAADDCLYEKGSLDKAYRKIIGTRKLIKADKIGSFFIIQK
jgi:hypothetical protein